MSKLLLSVTILVVICIVSYSFLHEESSTPTRDLDSVVITTADELSLASVDPTLRVEAENYISEITSVESHQISAETADDFVTGDQPISLSTGQEFEIITPAEIRSDSELPPDAPITLIREQEQVELNSPKQILADAGGDLASRVKILEEGQIRELTVAELLDEYPNTSESSVSVIRKVDQFEVTTVKQLLEDQSIAQDEQIKFIRKPYKLQSTTVDELLMGKTDVADDSVFYIKNVTGDDAQGIWGIVHNSLVRNFASGIAIRRDEKIQKYQVDIPIDADERLANHSSSFLGKMIGDKTSASIVYNYEKGKMGRNPDLIYPGQEIVIISFKPDELIKIYQHFVSRSKL
jgi:hypothetical protein